jgi:ABC-type lipoprotein release transport system permease subunit
VAVSDGLRVQTNLSLDQGADLYLVRDTYGGSGPVSQSDLERLKQSLDRNEIRINGRIIGRTYFVNRLVALVGLDQPPRELAKIVTTGRIFQKEGEVLVGYHLAKIFNLQPGVRFSLAANQGKLFTLVGILPPLSIWDSDLLVMSLQDARQFFKMADYLSEIQFKAGHSIKAIVDLVDKPQGVLNQGSPPLRLMSRQEAAFSLSKGFNFNRGIFILFYPLILALAVPALLVTSGLGTSESVQEIGLMKALGWTRKNIFCLTILEGAILSLMATALAEVFSMVWMKGTNGFLITQFLIAESGLVPNFEVPTRYLPLPALAGLFFCLMITWGGNLVLSWYASRKAPFRAMQ